MRVTERDLKTFEWINGWGFVKIDQIAKYWGVTYPAAQARVLKYQKEELCVLDRVLYGESGAVRLTKKGVELIGDELPVLQNIRIGTYKHDLKVVDVCLSLGLVNAEPERRIRKRLMAGGVEKKRDSIHVPDFEIKDPDKDGKVIAFEIELTRKKKERLLKIIKSYLTQTKYSKVRYFCSPDVFDLITEHTSKYKNFFDVEIIPDE